MKPLFLCLLAVSLHGSTPERGGWMTTAPREEIRPHFKFLESENTRSLVIEMDERKGLHGSWSKTFSIQGGKHYRFYAQRLLEGARNPRRFALAKITWQDDQGRLVPNDNPTNRKWLRGGVSTHRPDYPLERPMQREGWSELTDVYKSPSKATKAVVELFFRWAPPRSRVTWKHVTLEPVSPPAKRRARLAAVHVRPRSEERTLAGNCRAYAPYIAEAARQRADFVVLGETIGAYGTGKKYHEVAEPIPGPSTQYFGKLAKQHDLYIVVGLNERDRHLIYNVAVLIGPDGKVAGKYRKTCLPRGEADGGIIPGNEFPVFDTRFGKVGMMVCYDAFFPEVARQLTINGAEVIALPVWGCNPELAAARATENHVWLVSSTYTDHNQNWIKTAIFNHEGEMVQQAKKWGEVIVHEVDLNARTHWHGLGDFKARINRARPEWVVEK